MKIDRVEIQDFRSFGQATFDLLDPESGNPLDVALIVGTNGSGKTSFLHAISAAVGTLNGNYGSDGLTYEDIRSGARECRLTVHLSEPAPTGRTTHKVEINLKHGGSPTLMSRPDQAWRQALQSGRPNSTGLLLYFDVYRLLPRINIEGPNIRGLIQNPIQGALTPTVMRGGGLATRFNQLKQWIVNLDFWRAKAKADRGEDLPGWGNLRRALDAAFAPVRFAGVDDRFEVQFDTPHGRIPLHALSDGFRTAFVVVAETLFRCSLATEEPARALEQEAVCLIDEVDAHLHPSWQTRIVPGLRAIFPRVQFIGTTHSPLVISSVHPKNVFQIGEAP